MKTSTIRAMIAVAVLTCPQIANSAVDAEAARVLAKKEGCLKCHGIDRDKTAKSLTAIAGKFKGVADADAKLLWHITTGPKVKDLDGGEDVHDIIKTNDKSAINNLIGRDGVMIKTGITRRRPTGTD